MRYFVGISVFCKYLNHEKVNKIVIHMLFNVIRTSVNSLHSFSSYANRFDDFDAMKNGNRFSGDIFSKSLIVKGKMTDEMSPVALENIKWLTEPENFYLIAVGVKWNLSEVEELIREHGVLIDVHTCDMSDERQFQCRSQQF